MKSIGPILIMLISVMAFYILFPQKYAEIGELRSLNSEYKRVIDQSENLEEKVKTLFAKYDSFSQSDLANIEKMVPERVDNSELSNYLSNIAGKNSISISNLKLTRPTARRGQENADAYNTIIADFSVVSNYENMLSFLRDIEGSLVKLDVVSLSVRPATAGFYRVNVSVQAYELNTN